MSDDTQVANIFKYGLSTVHFLLAFFGLANVVICYLIIKKPYLRSITNVYMWSLCLADFIYIAGLSVVASTALNNKSWPFGHAFCSIYYGTESTAKYSSVLFIMLLSIDRFVAVCKGNTARGYRTYRFAIFASAICWVISLCFSSFLFIFAKEKTVIRRYPNNENISMEVCVVDWPNQTWSQLYLYICWLLLYFLPGCVIIFCYVSVFNKLKEHMSNQLQVLNSHRRRSNRYRRVTNMVLMVIVFHFVCWSPFWFSNIILSLWQVRVTTLRAKVMLNLLHLLPYVNCALNPILYAWKAENFEKALRQLGAQICCQKREKVTPDPTTTMSRGRSESTPDNQRNLSIRPVYEIEESCLIDDRPSSCRIVELRFNEPRNSAQSIVIPIQELTSLNPSCHPESL